MTRLGENPTLSVQEDLTNPALFVPRQFEEQRLANEDELTTFKLDVSREMDSAGITSISAGVRFSTREKEFLRLANRFTDAFVPDDATLPLDDSFVLGIATPQNGPQYIAWDLNRLQSRFAAMTPQADAAMPAPLAANTLLLESGVIEEDNLSGYLQVDFDFDLGNVPVSGNIGVRYADTDLGCAGAGRLRIGRPSLHSRFGRRTVITSGCPASTWHLVSPTRRCCESVSVRS